MGVWDPEHFLIYEQGAIHAIKEIELDTKFQETIRAAESVTLEVELSKMAYKDELKKVKETILPSRQLGPARLLLKRPNSQEGRG